MKFKEWYLLNEMPHMVLPKTPVNGIVGDAIDFRVEDMPSGKKFMFMNPWVAQTQEGWLVHDGRQNLTFIPELGERESQLVKLPSDWWRFAVVVDSNRVVKGPERDRIVHGGPQSLGPQPQSQKIA